jgi:hypothetical protein
LLLQCTVHKQLLRHSGTGHSGHRPHSL